MKRVSCQVDCGGSVSFNDLVCNTTSHRCECTQAGWGICQRFFPAGTGLCGRCCPGSVYGLGFGVRCRADFNDPRACGTSCETCDDHECCINGTCFNSMGCAPGFGGGGCTGRPCGSCTFFCPPETPLCCAVGPAAVPTCVAGTNCP